MKRNCSRSLALGRRGELDPVLVPGEDLVALAGAGVVDAGRAVLGGREDLVAAHNGDGGDDALVLAVRLQADRGPLGGRSRFRLNPSFPGALARGSGRAKGWRRQLRRRTRGRRP